MSLKNMFLTTTACLYTVTALLAQNGDFSLALAEHKGRLTWSAKGFAIAENSAKANGHEIGVRASDAAGRLGFLGFLFLAPETAPMTSAACREAALAQDREANTSLSLRKTSELAGTSALPVALATYSAPAGQGAHKYVVRGFVATADICGDLQFYSPVPISEEDAEVKRAFLSLRMDPEYTPRFADIVFYAQVLYLHHGYAAAGSLFEKALAMVPRDGAPFKSERLARRIVRDQAGIAYGIAGELSKARSLSEKGVAEDPDYPMNYYNLACADAEEKNLSAARAHLRQAFERRANMNPGEKMPVPTEDDSFVPYRGNKEFWTFLESIQAGK